MNRILSTGLVDILSINNFAANIKISNIMIIVIFFATIFYKH